VVLLEEEEVKEAFQKYLESRNIVYFLGKGAGPDFKFEDGSVAEAKGSIWQDVGAVLEQIAEYYFTSTRVSLVFPCDAMNLERAFRLLMLEKLLMRSKQKGETLRLYLVSKIDDVYKICQFDSIEDFWKRVCQKIEIEAPAWYEPPNKRQEFIQSWSIREGNEMFKSYAIKLFNERAYDIS
jgi:hypothetical protein